MTGSTLMCWRRCSRNAVRTVGRRKSRLDHRFSLGALQSELPPPWHVWCLNRSAPHNALISSHIFSSGGKVGSRTRPWRRCHSAGWRLELRTPPPIWAVRRVFGPCEEPISSNSAATMPPPLPIAPPAAMAASRSPLARLSQLGPDLRNFALPWCRKSSEHRGASRCEPAKTGCGADQPPCETASRFGRLAPCFYATSCAARTARSTAIGALSRTAGYPAGGRCSDTCFIWARSTTASAPHGVRRSRRSTRTGRAANRSHCSPRIVRRRHWIAMWCMSGSAVCAYAGRGNGVAAGWRAICGISFNWMSSGHHVCRYRDRGHAG